MRLIYETYGLLTVSIIVAAVFLFLFARLMGSDGLGSIYNRAVAFGGESVTSYLLSGAKLDSNGYIVMDDLSLKSSSEKLYRVAKTYDLELFETPKFSVTNKDNVIVEAVKDGSGNVVGDMLTMYASDWCNQIGISSVDGLPITVLVSEYTPITSTSPKASTDGSMYYLTSGNEFTPYLGGSSIGNSGERQDGLVLYSMQDVYDEFGNKVVEDGKIKQSMQVIYDGETKYTQDEINSGVVINYDIAKKYKVTYRIEKGKIKSEYNAVFVNETRELGTSDDLIKDLFEQLYKNEGSEG